jgi:hypothetical protein
MANGYPQGMPHYTTSLVKMDDSVEESEEENSLSLNGPKKDSVSIRQTMGRESGAGSQFYGARQSERY